MFNIQDCKHPISLMELWKKVTKISQEWWIPFKEGVQGLRWLCWFRKCHSKFTLQAALGLEEGRARDLSTPSVVSFYENLHLVYTNLGYSPS